MTFRNSVKLQESEARKFNFAIEMSNSEVGKNWIMYKRLDQLFLYAINIIKYGHFAFTILLHQPTSSSFFPESVGRWVGSKNITRDVKYETLALPINNLMNSSNSSISILISCRTVNKLHVHYTDRMVTSV